MIEIKRRHAEGETSFSDAVPPLLKRIYANRGIYSEHELERSAKGLLNFNQLFGMQQAVLLLAEAMEKQQRIIIIGDFDADGATSTALSVRALRLLGAANVDYLIPNRFDNGYGLSPEVVEQAALKGVDLIITVDNGISSIQGVQAAKDKGLTVVVTDHHLPATELPNADAIVNPNLNQCSFPSKSLAGVGVAFYLMLALRAHLRTTGWFAAKQLAEPNLAILLDLVAFGTVADVVKLDKNNRILVHQGLQRIRAGQCIAGIQALAEVAKRNLPTLIASDFGFALGPRLNAAGRLDDMSCGVELLLTDNLALARQMALELDGLNQTRREIEAGMKEEAIAICAKLKFTDGELPYGLTLYQQEWHQGVIGILASRIKDQFHRPVIAFADDDGVLIKGSARSISGLHIRDTLDLIDTKNPGLIKKFGGHAMAAGLTIAKADLARFSTLFAKAVKNAINEEDLKGVLLSDGSIDINEFSMETAELLQNGGPWGQGFPEPLFDGKFKILQQRLLKDSHLKLLLEPMDEQYRGSAPMIDAIAFNVDRKRWPDPSVQQVEIAYRLSLNEFRGKTTVQLMIEHLKAL